MADVKDSQDTCWPPSHVTFLFPPAFNPMSGCLYPCTWISVRVRVLSLTGSPADYPPLSPPLIPSRGYFVLYVFVL